MDASGSGHGRHGQAGECVTKVRKVPRKCRGSRFSATIGPAEVLCLIYMSRIRAAAIWTPQRPAIAAIGEPVSAQCTTQESEPGPRRGESPAHTHTRPPSGLHTVQHTPTAITHRSTTSGPALPTKAWCTRPPHAREGRTPQLLVIPAAPTT